MNRKQMRHWSLVDIEHCPFLSPLRVYNRMLGGTSRSFKVVAQCIYSNRRIALRVKSGGNRFGGLRDGARQNAGDGLEKVCAFSSHSAQSLKKH
jgi:hypothetical protein